MKIFQVIIGTEILNGRREDSHFKFLRDLLIKRGYELFSSFIIKDDPKLIKDVFTLIKNTPDSMLFCYGGIGATPDDYTRQTAADVFTNGIMEYNGEFIKKIDTKFPSEDNTKKYALALWPKDAKPLWNNPVNGFPGFYIKNRHFFMPGFPQMAHPMSEEAVQKFLPKKEIKKRYSLIAYAKESEMLDIMRKIPENIEFSTLPKLDYTSEISFAGKNSEEIFNWFKEELKKNNIKYSEINL
ncbi:MAG: competence/damage-inducible protein A [Epsilonproteobacteria bacterium]|nr:competence/damage-inducible protein A [Campylobacterota bacterium]